MLAQVVVCENSSCTANDYNLDSFYLGDANGTPFDAGYCDPGETVNAHIWTNFSANSNANRYSLYLHYNLYIDGVFIETVDECFYEGQPIPTNISLDIYNFNWSCGSVIELQDFYMSWQPNANADCGCSNAKCYTEPSIIVEAPLIANFDFNPSCLSAYTLDFVSTTTGGTPPYSYEWDFGDGTTSNLANPSHTYDSTGPYTVNLTVYDADNFDFHEFEIVDFNPNLPPELFAPQNENIEGCDITALNTYPFSSTPVEITENQFNSIGGSLILSSAILSLTYVDTISGSCPTTITRTFSVTDSCNHSTTDTQVIIINDTTLPTASNPETILVQCASDIPPPNTSVVSDANDNCSSVTVAFIQETTDNNSCPEIITRTYSVTDDCGNSIEVSQNIIINDDILPTASTPPILTLQCFGDVPAPDINVITDASDNCSIPTILFISESTFTDTCPLTINRIYEVSDDCGNSINITHTIVVDDTIDPTAIAPNDINVQCSSDVPAPDISTVTNVSDNCGTPNVEFVSDISNSGTCPEVISRIYTVTDDCGNQIILTQNITIVDDIVPIASTPSPINVQCVSDVPAPDISVISDAVDNCSIPLVSFISDVTTGQCPQLIQRTYRIEDGCGNYIDIIQEININDDIAPTASNPSPIYFDCSTGIPVPDPTVVTDASDNCSVPNVEFVSDTSDGLCPETITRIYSISDECGNTTNVSQNLVSTDTEAPTLIGPLNNETVDCLAIPDAPLLTFTDNCSTDLTIAFSETDTNMNDTVDYDITRVWIVTDDCGNQSTFTQIIHVLIANCIVSACNSCGPVDDIIPPTASNPADINVNCTDDIPPPDPTVVIDEADNCVPPVVAFVSENVSVDCFQKVERIYSVTDECGNVIYVSHFINVIDNVFPTASNPAPLNVDCTDNIPAPDVNVVIDEADNCSTPTVAFVSDVADNSSCSLRILRTYSVTDSCGNSIEVNQEINVIDNIPPTATAPSNLNISCLSEVPIPDTSDVTNVNDNCSNTYVEFISDISDNNICPETITRTYRVSDDCDNYIDITQIITIYDDIAPTASNPTTLQFSCPGDVPTPNINVVTDASDNCSTPIINFESEISDNNTCPETITRTYSVTDICGNSIDVYQTIIIDDDIDPTASNPYTLQVSNSSSIPAPDISVVIDEADNCSIPTVAFVSETSDNLTCPETITRIYSVTDDCGNSINIEHIIIVNDDVPPTASTPQSLSFTCNSEVPAPNINVVTDANDNNSMPTVTFLSETNNSNSCPEIITRIYRVTDDCGNFIDVSQVIIIDDDIPPTASNPTNIEIYDVVNIPAPDINVVIDEADNCAIPTVAFVNEVSNNDTCQLILTRTYSVTDDCGNSINVSHDIIVYDNEAPTATAPQDLFFSCDSEVPAPNINAITNASDNFSTAIVSFVSDVSNEQTCPEIITRTYRIIDECGNFIDISHDITINDDINPTASNPQSITVSHISEVPAVDIEVVTDEADNCSIPIVAFVSETSDNQSCPETLTRIYSVTDACGNSINVFHNILINDSEPPIVNRLNDINLSCISDVPVPDVSLIEATDNSNTLTVFHVSDISDNNSCPETITRTYRVADDCGNFIDVTQLFTIYDDIPPTASNLDTITVDCLDNIPSPDISVITDANDNCSTPTVTFVSDTHIENRCGGTISRLYSVSDDCGNSINVTQQIIYEDTTNPELAFNLETEMTIFCGEVPDIPELEFSDNCSSSLEVYFNEDIDFNNDNLSYNVVRNWTVIDECGNTSIFNQTIYMIVENEVSYESISLCIDEEPINLNDLVDLDENGVWESDSLDVLDNMEFNPYVMPEGDYTFRYTVEINECLYTKDIYINVNDDCIKYPCIRSINDVDISVLVTPNGDLKNETFDVSYILNPNIDDELACDIKTVVKIFNRWGTKVYQSNDYHNTWRGESPSGSIGNTETLPTGTYYYVVDLVNSGLKPIQGYILLGVEDK